MLDRRAVRADRGGGPGGGAGADLALEGFVDAGNAAGWPSGAMREGREARTLARFESTSSSTTGPAGPPLRFDTDHWESYAAPRPRRRGRHRHGGHQQLLSTGPEPDSQLERSAAAAA